MLGQGQLGWAIRLGTESHTWAPEASHNDVIAKASNPDSPDPPSAGTLRQSPKLSTPSFTQETLPASLGFPGRSKSEDIKHLYTLRDCLKGDPLEVCNRQTCSG